MNTTKIMFIVRTPVLLITVLLAACASNRSVTQYHPDGNGSIADRWDELLTKGNTDAVVQGVKSATRSSDISGIKTIRDFLEVEARAGKGSSAVPTMLAQIDQALGRSTDALFWFQYTVAVTSIDIGACADPSAGVVELEQLGRAFPALRSSIAALPVEQKRELTRKALAFEARTWPNRSSVQDRWVCSGGVREIQRQLPNSVQRSSQPPAADVFSTDVAVPNSSSYKSQFRNLEDWSRFRETTRSKLLTAIES